ncbi:MAG: DUF58 domain-containing protein [Gammaproteobacteria bacterium]|nr:DUF58 domain-containing protein [Gammaproteobacteria bacterium]
MAFADWARIEKTTAGGRAEIGARRIYILPTRYGMIYAALLTLMLLGAINYGNNPAHLLTFLLAALGSNAIYQTWRNLRGLRLVCLGAEPVFAGQRAHFRIDCDPVGRERPAIQLGFEDAEPALLDLKAGTADTAVSVPLPLLPRGLYQPGRLTVSTQYPVGLFRAWCYVDCERDVLVYPQPGVAWQPVGDEGEQLDGGFEGSGNEDFAGLRGYVPGDQASRIDWKSFARDRGLNTRLFSGQAASPLWIEFEQAPGGGVEERLSALARAVLDAEQQGRFYGLRLPGCVLTPDAGPLHRHQCLRALAVFGLDDD